MVPRLRALSESEPEEERESAEPGVTKSSPKSARTRQTRTRAGRSNGRATPARRAIGQVFLAKHPVAEGPVGSQPNRRERLSGNAEAVRSTSSSTPAQASIPSSCRSERARLCDAVGGWRGRCRRIRLLCSLAPNIVFPIEDY